MLDRSNAIVNGDCYCIKLRKGVPQDWLLVILAVASSTIATTFYDTMFHNKLYAGRSRVMTQYVKAFPRPSLDCPLTTQIIQAVKRLLNNGTTAAQEAELKSLVQQAFGFRLSRSQQNRDPRGDLACNQKRELKARTESANQ